MSYQLEIKVTKEILERSMQCGINHNSMPISQNCAIALAVREIFPEACVTDAIYPFGCYKSNSSEIIFLNTEVSRFILRFDVSSPSERRGMHEFTFTVDVPDCVIEQIDITAITQQLQNSSTLKLLQV